MSVLTRSQPILHNHVLYGTQRSCQTHSRTAAALRSSTRGRRFAAVLSSLLCLVLIGCGGGDDQDSDESEKSGSAAAAKDKSGKKGEDQQASAIKVDSDGQKWYGNVPLDVWYNDPLGELQTPGSVPTNPSNGNPATNPNTPTVDPSPSTESNASADWTKLLPVTVLDNEIKNTSNQLKEKVQTTAAFNGGYLELPPYIATMAAFAHVATLHSEEVRWKEHAPVIRTLGAQMLAEPLRRGAAGFRKLQAEYEPIAEILAGSSPAAPPEIPADVTFVDVAAMSDLMKRLELAQNWLKVNANSEASLKSNADQVKHEAHVIASLAEIIAAEGYGYFEDEDFLGHSRPMRDAAMSIVDAADSGDFSAYELSSSRIMQSCTECHSDYRG